MEGMIRSYRTFSSDEELPLPVTVQPTVSGYTEWIATETLQKKSRDRNFSGHRTDDVYDETASGRRLSDRKTVDLGGPDGELAVAELRTGVLQDGTVPVDEHRVLPADNSSSMRTVRAKCHAVRTPENVYRLLCKPAQHVVVVVVVVDL